MPKLSFEVFPPKREQGIEHIQNCIDGLCALKPEFISVTYNTSSSLDNLTIETCHLIKEKYGIDSIAHLTCAGNNVESIKKILTKLKENNINKVLALRGDLSPGKQIEDLKYATDLIKIINDFGGFEVSASCYPEGHTESKNSDLDIKVMKMKDDLGVKRYLSQLFFDNNFFYDMVEKARNIGVKGIIEPGIMPILNKNSITRMVSMCGTSIPNNVAKNIAKYSEDKDSLIKWGVEFASNQIIEMFKKGFEFVHLYTMDNVEITRIIQENVKSYLN